MNIVADQCLKSVDDIESYFKDNGYDFFDCGQGYSQDKAEAYAKVGEDYYLVRMTGDVVGEKQDRGDRLYFIDCITSVTYEKVEKSSIDEIERKEIIDKITRYQAIIDDLKSQLESGT